MDLVFSEVSKTGLFRCGEVVRPEQSKVGQYPLGRLLFLLIFFLEQVFITKVNKNITCSKTFNAVASLSMEVDSQSLLPSQLPVCDVEACEGAREHNATDDINPLGPGVEVEPELGAEDGLDPLPASLPHDGWHQGREQNGLWRIFRSLL